MNLKEYLIGECNHWVRKCDLEIGQSEETMHQLHILIDEWAIDLSADGYLYTNPMYRP